MSSAKQRMPHPLMYVLGITQQYNFPLILIIGREPNYDGPLDNSIGIIDNQQFKSMPGGAWVTAYTQIAKQYYGASGTSKKLKDACIKRNASPIVFSNAFPMGILNHIKEKASIRRKTASLIPSHVAKLFNSPLSGRFKLVIQHGTDESEASIHATEQIKNECMERNIPYFSTPFFYNGNSANIQKELGGASPDIKSILAVFFNEPNKPTVENALR